MYAYTDDGCSVDHYQKSVRDRANASLHDLDDILTGVSPQNSLKSSSKVKDQLASAVHPRTLHWFEERSRPQKYKDAASQLTSLLSHQQSQAGPEPRPVPQSTLPSREEAFNLLQSHASYTQQLETENIYIKLEEVFGAEIASRPFLKRDIRQLQLEMEKLNQLHCAKSERLEAQLEHTRSEVVKYEQLVEDLRSQLRMQDTIPTREDGLGIFMGDSNRSYLQQTIDRLTNSTKRKVQEMIHREEEAYQQMKKGIQLVEEAQLEQTQELNSIKQRFDNHIKETQHKMQEDRDTVRKETKHAVDELNKKMKEIVHQNAALSAQLEKLAHEKATENYRTESASASLQKSQSHHEVGRLRQEIAALKSDRDKERSRMQSENEDLRRRLTKAERDLVNSKEECIHLTTNNQAFERELHLAKLARDGIERGRVDDMKALAKRSKMREEEMTSFVNDIEEQHERTTSEMDTMLKKQNRLIGKLRDECKKQAGQIDKMTKKNRNECGKLKKQNEELRFRLERAVNRLAELENQTEQHARVHEKMKERLKQMDDHAQNQSQQILDALSKCSSLMRDRQLLAREVEFLRRQISYAQEEDIQKYISSNKPLVDEVLSTITAEEWQKKESYMTSNKENNVILDDDS
ncbi:hypothetical protein KUTeg_012909 [Tegillarca granosa]|uniref:Uncharacterized protein n=1 Tax=Tegillarca granosa TaxID=220873 RepID=A0ABQ9EWA9_TEGGR|nr:hypothetical protein KUTeg_012909 [Tegillarca granosa]